MAHPRLLLPALVVLAVPGSAQSLPDLLKNNQAAWEDSLAKGVAVPVRKAAEALLAREGTQVSPSDYIGMYALVGVQGLAARACVIDGAWEDAVVYLQKATQTAADNSIAFEGTFAKIRQQHQESLAGWRPTVTKLEQRLKDLDAQVGLTSDQIKTRTQIRAQLDELHNAIDHGESSLKEIANLTGQLKQEQETYAASLARWQDFLAKEKADLTRAGSVAAYVGEKVEQVKGDDAKPLAERLTYARRLLRLDPASPDCQRLGNALSGKEDEPPPKPPAKKGRGKKAAE